MRVVSFTLIVVLFFLSACTEEEKDTVAIKEVPENAPDREGWQTTVVLSDSLGAKTIVHMGHARAYDKEKETIIDSGLYVRFLDREGNINATLTADSARMDDNTGNMCAFGRVHVYSQKNRTTVDTEKLCYEKESGRFHSDARVNIVDSLKRRNLKAIGFTSDESLKEYDFYQVTGTSSF